MCSRDRGLGQEILGEHCAQKRDRGRSRSGESPKTGITDLDEVHVDFTVQRGHCLLASAELQSQRVSPLENSGERWGCQDVVLAHAKLEL